MRIYVLAVLLLTFLLVSDSEGAWFKKTFKRIRIKKLAKFVRKNERNIQYGLLAAKLVGKRSAESPCPPGQDDNGMDREMAMNKLKELSLQCPNFGINGQKLTKATVLKAFDKVDADNDEAFDGDELKEFENVLDAYKVCADRGADQGKNDE